MAPLKKVDTHKIPLAPTRSPHSRWRRLWRRLQGRRRSEREETRLRGSGAPPAPRILPSSRLAARAISARHQQLPAVLPAVLLTLLRTLLLLTLLRALLRTLVPALLQAPSPPSAL